MKECNVKKVQLGKAVKRVKQKTGQSKGGKKSNIKKLLQYTV